MPRSRFPRFAAGLLLAACLSSLLGLVAQNKPAPPPPKLKVGDMAPEFKLQYFDGQGLKDVSLSQYRGKSNVIVAFYIFAFTGG
jgi:hypothetical protein